MRTNARKILLFLVMCTAMLMTIAGNPTAEETPVAKLAKLSYLDWYVPVEYSVQPAVKGYQLPLAPNALTGSEKALNYVNIPVDSQVLLENGFAVTDKYSSDNLSEYYDGLLEQDLPIFITTDCVLHLFHVLFDKVLADLEEKVFLKMLREMCDDLAAGVKIVPADAPEEVKQAYILAGKYLAVAKALAEGATTTGDAEVDAELKMINGHVGFRTSSLFKYDEDYSQYVPRGHYTRSKGLGMYFRSMMYLGRLTFLLKGKNLDDKALVEEQTAKIQTLAASLLARNLVRAKTFANYEAIYKTTCFFVGYADDATPFEYSSVTDTIIGPQGNIAALADPPTFLKLQFELLKVCKPTIYSGTGQIFIDDPKALAGEPSPEILQKYLGVTAGMRFMGQRFVIDSYILGKFVFPTIGNYEAQGNPINGNPYRLMPTSLDVMSALGNKYAESLTHEMQISSYKGYLEELKRMREEIAGLKNDDWHRNLYMGWLDTLRATFADAPEGYQPFQRSMQWNYRKLAAALGSWAALRHDTILYVKQSYTLGVKGMPPPPLKAVGFVEPAPEVYSRLLSLLRMMETGVTSFGAPLDPEIGQRFKILDNFLARLQEISIAELENRDLTKDQNDFLENVAEIISGIMGSKKAEFSTELVVDVHTDMNEGKVLQCGTGKMNTMAVAYARPDGTVMIALGPVYSFYEFHQDLVKRLTDEQWREMLQKEPPEMPAWMREYMSTNKPLAEERF